jgi:ketosteroid isomerase-like protein
MQTIKQFFDKYNELSQGKDLKTLADCYAEHFIAAGPKGIMAFSNDEKFMEWLKAVQEFNQKSGMQGMKPINIFTT